MTRVFQVLVAACSAAVVVANDQTPIPNQYTTSVFLPFIKSFSSYKEGAPEVRGGIGRSRLNFPVDTSTTGIVIGSSLVRGLDVGSSNDEGYQYQHGKLYTGRYVTTEVNFYGQRNMKATAKVPVLVVSACYECPYYQTANTPGQCPDRNGQAPPRCSTDKVLNMGVGFGRSSTDGTATTPKNPFLNIESINGRDVDTTTYRNGYVLSTEGVRLGLTADNTDEAKWVDLDQVSGSNPVDYQDVDVQFKVNDDGPYSGRALVDTSIGQMYLEASPEGELPTDVTPVRYPPPYYVKRVKQGTKLRFAFPDFEQSERGFMFRVGDYKFPSQPDYVQPVDYYNAPYVNTGRKLLYGFTIAYDYSDGRLGFICKNCPYSE